MAREHRELLDRVADLIDQARALRGIDRSDLHVQALAEAQQTVEQTRRERATGDDGGSYVGGEFVPDGDEWVGL